MKKKVLIIITILIISIISFWCIEYYLKSDIYIFDKAIGVSVENDKLRCDFGNSNHLNSWNYYYTLDDRILYISVYNLSYFNPMAEHGWNLRVDIDKGYNDFDKVYINGNSEDKVLIWSKDNI